MTEVLKILPEAVVPMEDLAVFTAISHSGSFGKNFVKFKNNKYVICRLGGPYGEKL